MQQLTTPDAPRAHSGAFAPATLCEAFQLSATEFADQPALRTPGGEQSLTWREYAEQVRRIAGGLAELGVGRGDTLAMMLVNRPEFHLIDTAALHLGAIPFSIYNTFTPEQIEHLFTNAGNRVVITERRFIDTIRQVDAAAVEHVIVLEDGLPEAEHPDFEATWQSVQPDDIATLIYTSGTTGPPKGVQLTHRNLLFSLNANQAFVPFRSGGRLVSYLPHAHLADRFMSHYVSIATGSTITSVDNTSAVFDALTEVRPTLLLTVPRIWEKLKAQLEANGILEPGALPENAKAMIRERLGLDQADWVGSGAAPISPAVLEFFDALGLPILEGWAMSECGCGGTINPLGSPRYGTVGKVVPGIELRLADDGELLVRGPNVMPGYRNDPVNTAEAIDPDGWLHTGDIASIDEDGYVSIVDRKKELIINATGKNMSPANIEKQIKDASPLIGQACAIGDRRPYNVALILLDLDNAAGRAADDADVQREVAEAVERANTKLARVEQIRKFAILPGDWKPGGDEMTPTMKLKRRVIVDKYASEIDALYE
jgi:long-subunit acyl-CoA synthetase (AMP-forming)